MLKSMSKFSCLTILLIIAVASIGYARDKVQFSIKLPKSFVTCNVWDMACADAAQSLLNNDWQSVEAKRREILANPNRYAGCRDGDSTITLKFGLEESGQPLENQSDAEELICTQCRDEIKELEHRAPYYEADRSQLAVLQTLCSQSAQAKFSAGAKKDPAGVNEKQTEHDGSSFSHGERYHNYQEQKFRRTEDNPYVNKGDKFTESIDNTAAQAVAVDNAISEIDIKKVNTKKEINQCLLEKKRLFESYLQLDSGAGWGEGPQVYIGNCNDIVLEFYNHIGFRKTYANFASKKEESQCAALEYYRKSRQCDCLSRGIVVSDSNIMAAEKEMRKVHRMRDTFSRIGVSNKAVKSYIENANKLLECYTFGSLIKLREFESNISSQWFFDDAYE